MATKVGKLGADEVAKLEELLKEFEFVKNNYSTSIDDVALVELIKSAKAPDMS